ncbi:MAG: Sua5/YciO/YrdC/YwlC family protein, partial [Anaerolineaceae bacterium]
LWLLQAFGPLAVTSANLSGHENPTTAAEVIEQLDGRVDLILDGSTVTGGQASTIIDCAGTAPILLRQGPIPFDSILKVWNQA